jgi:thioredoxin-related protein
MKLFFTFLLGLIFSTTAFSQTEEAPYLQYKTVPSVRLILPDGTGKELKSLLDKKKSLMLMIFSPECDHCKHETEELIKNMDRLKKIQIVMISLYPLYQINEFVEHYQLNQYKNITVGRDYAYALPAYYDLKSLPYHAFYTKEKKLISGFEGSVTIEKILDQFK